MAKKQLSVEEVLAACRAEDGDGDSGSPPPAAEPQQPTASSETPAAPAGKSPAEMSVEEMLAAARSEKTGGESAAPATESSPPAEKPTAAAKSPGEMSVEEMLAAARSEKTGESAAPASEASPAAEKPTAAAKSPGEMSVAEMLAAARSEKSAPAAKKPAAKKPATKPAAGKAAAPKATAKADAGPLDTASILAASRKSVKRGPMSKAEAAAKGQPVVPAGKTKPSAPPMPQKPAYARRAEPVEPASDPDRRNFFGAFFASFLGSSLAVGFSSLAVTHVLWVLGLARFMFPNILIEPPTVFKVGFPEDYAPGQVETKFKAQFGVWVVRDQYEGAAQVFALKSVCTHLGCTPNWLEGEQKFKCPCHGSGFYKDGVNFEGPAPRPLERYAISLADDGQLEVDKSRTFQEEMGQWNDGASYVPV